MKLKTFEHDYRKLLIRILKYGRFVEGRNGITKQLPLNDLMFPAHTNKAPVITGKKIFWYKAYHEYVWIINGGMTTTYLNKHGIHWWDDFADKDGYLGKTYGYQINNYNGDINQVTYAINEILMGSRRAHITLWNPSDLNETALPCCYTDFTFIVENDYLHMNMNFRSSDVFVGLPYDMIFGALLLHNICNATDKNPAIIKYNLNNAHIYKNNIEQVEEYLKQKTYELPYMSLTEELKGYKHGPYIKTTLNK